MTAMKLGVVSDSHGFKFSCEPVDVFIHAGDLTGRGTYHESIALAKFLKETVEADHVLIVPGNHDLAFEEDLPTMKHDMTEIDSRIQILVDEGVTIDGISFWFSPWTPPFFQWAYMMEPEAIRKKFSLIPKKVDILVTHGPPYGILDPGYKEPHVGSHDLLEAVLSRDIKHHFFGHLHGAGGQNRKIGNTEFHNVAMVDDNYKPQRGPLIIDL